MWLLRFVLCLKDAKRESKQGFNVQVYTCFTSICGQVQLKVQPSDVALLSRFWIDVVIQARAQPVMARACCRCWFTMAVIATSVIVVGKVDWCKQTVADAIGTVALGRKWGGTSWKPALRGQGSVGPS
jgi:hypothetical protein